MLGLRASGLLGLRVLSLGVSVFRMWQIVGTE